MLMARRHGIIFADAGDANVSRACCGAVDLCKQQNRCGGNNKFSGSHDELCSRGYHAWRGPCLPLRPVSVARLHHQILTIEREL